MSDALKRAALALSALGAEDREWILQNLDQSERDRLESVLTEVEGPGPHADGQPMAKPFEDHMVQPPAPSAAPISNGRQRLIQADALDVMRVLGDEPDWMVAAVCGMWQWRWLPDLLLMLGEDRAQRVQRYMRTQPDHSNAVLDALTETLGKRLALGTEDGMFVAPDDKPVQVLRPRGRLSASFSRLTSWLL